MPYILLIAVACGGGTIDDSLPDTSSDEVSPYADCNGHSQVDEDYDGELEETHDLRYDTYGHLVYYSTDIDADGVLDEAYSYTLTESGEYLVKDFDSDGDGAPDARWTFLRDADEFLEQVEYDEGVDGVLDSLSTVTTTFDDDGEPLSQTTEKDDGLDGSVDEIESKTWDYDSTGYWTITDTDVNADGTPELRYEARFDFDDVKQGHKTDYGADGSYEREAEFHFDEDGRVYRVDVTTTDAAGTVVLSYVFQEYDEFGRIAEMLFDEEADGSIEARTTFTWDCL